MLFFVHTTLLGSMYVCGCLSSGLQLVSFCQSEFEAEPFFVARATCIIFFSLAMCVLSGDVSCLTLYDSVWMENTLDHVRK